MGVVLCYHLIRNEPDPHATSPARFREHLLALRGAGYRFIGHDEFAAQAARGGGGDRRTVHVTTDDGNADNWYWAFPILRELAIPATYFVITDEVVDGEPRARSDDGGAGEPAIGERLRWSELAAMQASGLISVQSHTARHRRLQGGAGAAGVDLKELSEDLARSRQAIAQRLGQAPVSLAWPWGANNAAMRNLAKQAGFGLQFSVVPGRNGRGTSRQFLYRYCADGIAVDDLLKMVGLLSAPFVGRSYSFARLVYNRLRNIGYGV